MGSNSQHGFVKKKLYQTRLIRASEKKVAGNGCGGEAEGITTGQINRYAVYKSEEHSYRVKL